MTCVLAAGRFCVVSLLGLGLDLSLRCGVRHCLWTSDLIPYVYPKSPLTGKGMTIEPRS